jgi:hypothetical protein
MNSAGRHRSKQTAATTIRETGRPVTCHGILSLLLMLACGVCVASDDTTAPRVDFNEGRLSVSATDISVTALLRLIGDDAGFEVVAYGDLNDHTGSWSFSDLPLPAAIGKLLRDTNSIVTYRSANHAGVEAQIFRIYLLGSSSATAGPIRIETVEPGLDNQLRLDQAQLGNVQSRLADIDRAEGLTDEITLQNLAFALRHDPDPEVRIRAIGALENIGGAAAVTALETGIGDQDARVRKKLMQTFANIDDERIPLWLGQVLMSDPAPEVRLEAVQAVARKEGAIAKRFLQAATGDYSSMVSEAALRLSR